MLAMPMAMDLARGAVFTRAVAVAFSPEYFDRDGDVDARGTRCRRITSKRFKCHYQFTMGDWYEEHGRLLITVRRQKLTTDSVADTYVEPSRGRR